MPSNDDSTAEGLRENINQNRIQYEPVDDSGVTIRGSPFLIRFGEPVDPHDWCDEISTAEDPWRMFAVGNPLEKDYHRLSCVLIHVNDNGETDGSTEMDLEVAPEWARVYVKGDDPDAGRIAEFVKSVLDEWGGEVAFGD